MEAIKNIGAVLDTSYLMDVSSRALYTIVAAHWLRRERIGARVPYYVTKEYNKYLAINAISREGIPKAQVALREILHGMSKSNPEWDFTPEDNKLLSNENLSLTDKVIVKEAEEIAVKTGQCYVLTNDFEIARQSVEHDRRIKPLIPSTIENKCSSVLPQIETRMMFSAEIIAGLYSLASKGLLERHYVLVERKKEYKYGIETIVIDTAKEIVLAEKGKAIPSKSREYGLAIGLVDNVNERNAAETFVEAKGGKPKKPMMAIFLQKSKKFLPYLARLGFNKEGSFYEELLWTMARSEKVNGKAYISPGA
jgi:hypothetical protein